MINIVNSRGKKGKKTQRHMV